MKSIQLVTLICLLSLSGSTLAQSTLAYANASVKSSNKLNKKDVLLAPAFMGGYEALEKYIAENLQYPEKAFRQRLEGTVLISCYINADGSIEDVRVQESVNVELDAEALRFVKEMPHWIPAMLNNQPHRVRYSLPVTFKLSF